MTNKIYTRRGDRGKTSLIGQGSVPKNDPRIHALGELDEANSAIGFARAALCASTASDALLDETLRSAQRCLPDCAALLAAQSDSHLSDAGINPAEITSLERFIDNLSELTDTTAEGFVLPGGCEKAARLHLARSIVRRAERSVVGLLEDDPVALNALAYLNRLSDALFAMAIYVNTAGEIADID